MGSPTGETSPPCSQQRNKTSLHYIRLAEAPEGDLQSHVLDMTDRRCRHGDGRPRGLLSDIQTINLVCETSAIQHALQRVHAVSGDNKTHTAARPDAFSRIIASPIKIDQRVLFYRTYASISEREGSKNRKCLLRRPCVLVANVRCWSGAVCWRVNEEEEAL